MKTSSFTPIARRLLLAAGLVTLTATVSAATFDFSTKSQFDDNFNQIDSQLSWSSDNGVGGVSGVVSVDDDGSTGMNYNQHFGELSPGDFITTGVFLRANAAANSAFTTTPAGVGITTVSDGGQDFSQEPTLSFAIRNQNTNFYRLRLSSRDGDGAVVDSGIFDTTQFNLTTGEWYELEATFTLLDTDGVFNVNGALYGRGADGTSARNTIASFSQNSSALGDLLNANIYTGFRASDSTNGGVDLVDNFVVIPEPGTLALVGMAFLALRIMKLKRRRF